MFDWEILKGLVKVVVVLLVMAPLICCYSFYGTVSLGSIRFWSILL